MSEEEERQQKNGKSKSIDYRKEKIVVEIDGATRIFEGFQEFENWHSVQWEAIGKYVFPSGSYLPKVRDSIYYINHMIDRYKDSGVDIEESDRSEFIKYINILYGEVFSTDSLRGEFLSSLAESDPDAAVSAYNYWMNLELGDTDNPDQFRGGVLALLIDEGVSSHKEKFEAVEQAEREYREWKSKAAGDYEKRVKDLDEVIERSGQCILDITEKSNSYKNHLDSWFVDFRSLSINFRDNIVKSAEADRDRLTSEVDNLIKTYDDMMALQWPTNYWQTKADFHAKKAKLFTGYFAVAALVSFLVVGFLSLALISPVEDVFVEWVTVSVFHIDPESIVHATNADGSKAPVSPIAKVTAFGAIMAIVLWILRLVARSMLSHQHLAADATERRVMILTYLALLRREKGISDEQLGLVLSSIFRPSTDGLVKSEQGPAPLPLEMMRMFRQ